MNNVNDNQRYNISLHIEELVLDGFPVEDQNRIISVVQEELHHLLSQGKPPAILKQNGNIKRLGGVSFEMEQGATDEIMGRQVARSLYGGLQR